MLWAVLVQHGPLPPAIVVVAAILGVLADAHLQLGRACNRQRVEAQVDDGAAGRPVGL